MKDCKQEYKYKFSVIMSIFNVEDYLEEAIESIIKQDIGFNENVQLILINDGSTDNSEEICLKYKEKYPNNIIYENKENGGLSSARNCGLKYVEGEYVTFTDPDDTLNPNVFSSIADFYKYNKLYVDMVCIPLYFFEAKTGLHQKYKYMGNQNRVINLIEEPYNFVLSSASTFYKASVIEGRTFDETMLGSEDLKFNIELYKNNPNIGYVCRHNAHYNYRQREASNSIVDRLKTDTRGFISVLRSFELLDIDNLPDYQKEMIIYELRSRLRNIRKEYFEDENDYNYLIEEYRKYIKLLPDDFIIRQSKFIENYNFKIFLLLFKGYTIDELISKHIIPIHMDLYIRDYYIKKDKFIIEVNYSKYDASNVDLVTFDGKNKIHEATKSLDIEGPYDIKYGEFVIDHTHYKKFEFDLKPKKIKFMLQVDGYCLPLHKIYTDGMTKLYLKSSKIGLRKGNKIVTFVDGVKFLIKQNKMSSFKYNLSTLFSIHKEFKYWPFMRLLNRRKKKYILVNDRPEKAGDNGEAIFKYINANEKEMAKNTYFVIDKKSPDYKKLKKYGKVVNKGSLRHRYLFLNSKFIYSSHNYTLFYSAFNIGRIKYYSDMFNYKFIWLQHGIIKDDLSDASNRIHTKNDKMVVSTNGEYNEIAQDKYLFDDKADIILTGLARYDYLENNPKNIITICPTWRKKLSGQILEDGTHETLPGFDESDYYLNYKSLLTNPKLHKMLEKYDYRINFVLHPGTINYKNYFDELANDRINIIGLEDVNYSKIFAESKLLITDYSSVFFDFAYLKKPEIFFQFDQDTFFEEHYKIGYFLYENDAFGDVITNADDVVNKIEFYFNNNFKMEDKYLKRVSNTFKYVDRDNCKRIIEATYRKK